MSASDQRPRTVEQFCHDVVIRAVYGAHLHSWAGVQFRDGGRPPLLHLLLVRADPLPLVVEAIRRGCAWSVRSDAPGPHPAGLEPAAVEEISAAYDALDANRMNSITASLLIQVGLFGEVKWP